ncbi:hypothetical protein HYR99_09395 [Candidatus Poribacteria bacterium]|nr:hypothetical protein [Candidatus Poribacteria bacterium]
MLSFEVTTDEVAEIEQTLEACMAEMQSANESMKQKQTEIDRLKAETRAIAVETQPISAQLQVAH